MLHAALIIKHISLLKLTLMSTLMSKILVVIRPEIGFGFGSPEAGRQEACFLETPGPMMYLIRRCTITKKI